MTHLDPGISGEENLQKKKNKDQFTDLEVYFYLQYQWIIYRALNSLS